MKLKEVDGVEVYITANGRIALKQDSIEYGQPTVTFLTLNQFSVIEDWVFKNRDEIDLLWNDGIEVEDDSEA
jgi:hypothetical protein